MRLLSCAVGLAMAAMSCGGSGSTAPKPATPEQMAKLVTFDSYEALLKAVFVAYSKGDAAAVEAMIAQPPHATAMCSEFEVPRVDREGSDVQAAIAKCNSVFTDAPAALKAIDSNKYGAGYTPDLAPSYHHWNDTCSALKIYSPTPYRYQPPGSVEQKWPVMELSVIYRYKDKWGLISVPTCRN